MDPSFLTPQIPICRQQYLFNLKIRAKATQIFHDINNVWPNLCGIYVLFRTVGSLLVSVINIGGGVIMSDFITVFKKLSEQLVHTYERGSIMFITDLERYTAGVNDMRLSP